jgi:hypothetical protein
MNEKENLENKAGENTAQGSLASNESNLYLPLSVIFSAVLLSASVMLVGGSIGSQLGMQTMALSELSVGQAGSGSPASFSGSTGTSPSGSDVIAEVAAEVIPTGVPAVYGEELQVSFDQVQDSLNKMTPLDAITLSGEDEQKYIAVGTSISCEYCCNAPYITAPNGQAACGCAHSAAMRGLAKYLIQTHNSQFSEEEILYELQQWKAVYFPKQTIAKAVQLKAEEGGVDATLLASLPDMVGGC